MNRPDILVVGGGPAGAVAAGLLARSGGSVLLVEKAAFPREKVCGCCINGQADAVLRRTGMGNLLAEAGAVPVRRMQLRARGRSADLTLPKSMAISRRRLDGALVRAAISRGVHFRDRTQARVVSVDPTGPAILLGGPTGREYVHPRVVVAADGLGGRSLSGLRGFEPKVVPGAWMGFSAIVAPAMIGWKPPFGALRMTVGRWGYVGQVRLEDGRVDVAGAAAPEWVRACGGPGPAAAALLAEAEPEANDNAWAVKAAWKGTGRLRRRRRVACPGVFVVGDAAGYVEPFTGEGIGWALAGAESVVAPVKRALEGDAAGAARWWARRHWWRTWAARWRCRFVVSVVHRPSLMRGAVEVFNRCPGFGTPLTQWLTTERAGLFGPPTGKQQP